MLCLIAQLCLTLCDSMGYSPLGSSVHGDSPGKNTGVGWHALLLYKIIGKAKYYYYFFHKYYFIFQKNTQLFQYKFLKFHPVTIDLQC